MSIFEQLSTNKGTVSSALSKTLAQNVLQEGQTEILAECLTLSSFDASKAAAKLDPTLPLQLAKSILPGFRLPATQTQRTNLFANLGEDLFKSFSISRNRTPEKSY